MAEKGRGLGKKSLNFGASSETTLGEVFGKKPISMMEMNKALWAFIKSTAGVRIPS